MLFPFPPCSYTVYMAKEETLKAAEEVARARDTYSLDWGLEKLLTQIKRNMDETAEALDRDYFPSDTVLPISQCAREATEYTGISSLAKALWNWVERHKDIDGISDIKGYAEEARKEAENVPF